MRIQLDQLPHQQAALEAIRRAFTGLDENGVTFDRELDGDKKNPLIVNAGEALANIDIKMETGTGKTYVGVNAMYELHKTAGLFKFIVVVPSPAIKEGWKSFIEAPSTRQHFAESYENARLDLQVISAGDFKARSGRKNFPSALTDFVESSSQSKNQIEVLLINDGMLRSSSMSNDNYDQTLLSGLTRPLDALGLIRPVVIIDEPHRFKRGGKGYAAIEQLHPQMILRFGATFPDITTGKGRAKQTLTDYYRGAPQYELTAVDSFNQGLIKGVNVLFPDLPEAEAKNLWEVETVTARQLVLKQGSIRRDFNVGDDIGFDGDITYAGGKRLSSGLELEKGVKLIEGTFSNSYQEMILREAIDRHFEIEWQNFSRPNTDNAPKIKTLSLFFIDSIRSYRPEKGEAGWLKTTFERLLTDKLRGLISDFERGTDPLQLDYADFLRATLHSLVDDSPEHPQEVHAGYFSEDRGSGDEAIQAQVDDILRNKEQLLSFKDERGKWNLRRFLFSKWTLREGWDNPNVFVLTKLRSSGSEISKVQEVGRGLRLPVDEDGHRVTDPSLPKLQFLVGYDEKDFAARLIGEVNADAKLAWSRSVLEAALIDELLKLTDPVGKPLFSSRHQLFNSLIDENHIVKDDEETFEDGGYDRLMELYPQLLEQENQLKRGKITTNQRKPEVVRLRKEKWEELRTVWQDLTRRYFLEFDRLGQDALAGLVVDTLKEEGVFQVQQTSFKSEELQVEQGAKLVSLASSSHSAEGGTVHTLPLGVFVSRIAAATRIPVRLLLRALQDKAREGTLKLEQINEVTARNIIAIFRRKFVSIYTRKYHYAPLDFVASTSLMKNNDFVSSVPAELVGTEESTSVQADSSYLYDRPPVRYDSVTPELDIIRQSWGEEVVAFGKLPKRAIQVPKFTGGTTTPDFVFKTKSGLCLFVEGKPEGDNKRAADEAIIAVQRQFFDMIAKQPGADIRWLEANKVGDVVNALREFEAEQEGDNDAAH